MILIANDGYHAHYFERLGWHKALSQSNVLCGFYTGEVGFDIFDKTSPTIFIGQLYNINSATIKCLKERPDTKVILRAGHYSDIKELVDNPNMLAVKEKEIRALEELNSFLFQKPVIYCHYLQKYINVTHKKFEELGNKIIGVPMSADICTYMDGKYDQDLCTDICFVGGYWPYKGIIIGQYLTPILGKTNVRAKIFGNQPWPHINQYCGIISDEKVKDLFCSSKVCPNLSEPHAHTYGFDLNERAFKVLAAGGVCVMDNVESAKEVFGEHVKFASDPKSFKGLIEYLIENPPTKKTIEDSKNFVIKNHTNFHRIACMMEAIGELEISKGVMNAHNNYIQQR